MADEKLKLADGKQFEVMHPALSIFLHSLVIALALLFLTPLFWSLSTSVPSIMN